MGNLFKFKQFAVDQRDCAMKINTDGVLLGALLSFEKPKRILDVGTGTGVIALMIAQRFDKSTITAVEVDELAYLRAQLNFEKSKFSSRLTAVHSSFESMNVTSEYELIVSNPPFFINSLQNPDQKRTLARHTDLDFFSKLLSFSSKNLSPRGSLQMILPSELAEEVVLMSKTFGFFLNKRIEVHSFENTESIRWIVDLRKISQKSIIEKFIIYKSKGEYSDHYKRLLSPFFLSF